MDNTHIHIRITSTNRSWERKRGREIYRQDYLLVAGEAKPPEVRRQSHTLGGETRWRNRTSWKRGILYSNRIVISPAPACRGTGGVMGLRPTEGDEKRLVPATTLYGIVTLSLSSRPELSWACGPPKVMKNAFCPRPLSMEAPPSPLSSRPKRSVVERSLC
jgi:hypothetical protein